MVSVGQKALDFSLPSVNETEVRLSDFEGKNIVLYFYPRDNTPGCTAEAKDFSAYYEDFAALNTIVLGVSRDSIKSHTQFRDKFSLPFLLLSDVNMFVCKMYGVLVEKSMFGKKYMGIDRSTFLIDSSFVVREVWHNVKVTEHVRNVLDVVRTLQ